MRFALLALALLVLVLPAARATTYVVRPDGTGDFPTIQAAVTAAVNGDRIELADGTFFGDGNRDVVFTDQAITVHSQSGHAASCVIDAGGSPTEPHRCFLFGSGTWADVSIEDLTLMGGHASIGGACYLSGHTSPGFSEVIFYGNTADLGGAIGCVDFGWPSAGNCQISNNSATTAGGAVYAAGGGGITITDSRLRDNSSGGNGGAICCVDQAQFVLDDCILSWNSALNYGGAIYCSSNGFHTLSWVTLSGSTALHGGGIAAYGASDFALASVLISGVATGSAIECGESGTASLNCCDLYGNVGGDWVGAIAGQLGVNDNVNLDPQYCSTNPDLDANWGLQSDSPCLPEASGCGDLIGARGAACNDTPAATLSWGELKTLYR